jgi:hypothetical protein
VAVGGGSGISSTPPQWNAKLQIGRRSVLLLSLLVVGWVIRGGNQLTEPSVLCLVVAWGVVSLVNMWVDTRLSPEVVAGDDLLVIGKS